jgi:hypothetical protein
MSFDGIAWVDPTSIMTATRYKFSFRRPFAMSFSRRLKCNYRGFYSGNLSRRPGLFCVELLVSISCIQTNPRSQSLGSEGFIV